MDKFLFKLDKSLEYSQNNINSNNIDNAIKYLFKQVGYDKDNQNNKFWNPFRNLINDGQVVVIKPNLVFEERNDLLNTNCITTHASIIKPILDFLYDLKKIDKIEFKVIIADVPLQSANFNLIIEQTRIKSLLDYYSEFDFNIELLDLRKEITFTDSKGFVKKRIQYNGDPLGYTKVHLEKSFLNSIINDYKKFSIGDYNNRETKNRHKKSMNHYYLIPNTILSSDLFINVPKIKTHQKAGITIALKNIIGINGDKSWIPHYRIGSPKFGGDEFSDSQYLLKYANSYTRRLLQGKSKFIWGIARNINRRIIKNKFLRRKNIKASKKLRGINLQQNGKLIMDGSWFGNNTLWRPILDLNYLLYYADKNGVIKNKRQRKYICLADGIIAAEKNGPLYPSPKKVGLITLSENPVINDICCSRLMGFDWKKIKHLANSVELKECFTFNGKVDDLDIIGSLGSNSFFKYDFNDLPNLHFIPSQGWKEHIELKD